MKRFCFLFVIFVLLSAQAASAATVVDSTKYLILVREGNPSLLAGIKSVEAAYFGVLASVAYQRPTLSGTASTSYLTGQNQGGNEVKDITSSNLSIGLAQRIDISGKYTLDEQQQILNYERQRALFDNDVNGLLANAEGTFWTAVLARENIVLQKDVLRQRIENNRVTQEKYKQQLVPKLDIIRSEAQVVAAETSVTEAESQYQNLLATMKYLAGGVEIALVDTPLEVPPFNVYVSLEKALSIRPDLRASTLALSRSKVLKKLTAKGLTPTLDASINWVPFSDPWNSSSPQKNEAVASLRLNIPIVDGNQTKYSVLNVDRQLQAAEAGLEAVKNTADMELTVATNNWNKAEALERNRKRQVERSDEELRITELMYNEGMGAQIDLINAQTENQKVRTEYLDAVKGMYIALVDLRKAIGDYAPNEEGSWKDAIVKYGKGVPVHSATQKTPAKAKK